MKIAHVLQNPGLGGSEKYALYLAQAAQKNGHEVLFIVGSEGPLLFELKKGGIDYVIIAMPSWHSSSAAKKVGGYCLENNINILHTHHLREHFLSVSAKRFATQIKVVRTFHRIDRLPLKVKPFYCHYLKGTDSIIAITPFIENYLVKNGVPIEKITIIENAVPQVRVKKIGKGIGFLGRISPEKGILDFVRQNNQKISPKNPLYIAGDGPDMSPLKEIAQTNNGIQLLGNIHDPAELFQHISVLVLPSQNEVLPLSILEAFSAGIPVVSFDIEPLSGIVKNENGLMVRAGDYQLLFDQAQKLTSDKVGLAQKSNQAKKDYAEKYQIPIAWTKLEHLYERVAKLKNL